MVQREPLFLKGRAGPLHATAFRPEAEPEPSKWLLHLPAFAEEANKARRMVALQAEAFAETGVGVLLLDPFGTGDSAGEFEQADWTVWCSDVADTVAWLRTQRSAQEVALWGHRAGCLLASAVLRSGDVHVEQVLYWNPVLNGRQFLQAFLRLRTASAMIHGRKESTEELLSFLRGGEFVEVAGYRLSPGLALSLTEERLEATDFDSLQRLLWVETTASGRHGAAGRKLLDTCAERVDMTATALAGDPFWSTQEITEVPALIDATSRLWARESHGV